jgi:SCY1-like protein 2
MFSKFVSSVSSNIYKTYEVQPNPKFHSGPWAVYDATRRASSPPRPAHQNQVSVFVFEKKSLEQSTSLRGSGGSTRTTSEIVFTRLKKEVSLLSRLRHPCLLEVVEPIEETRGALTFATERVISNLQLLVGGIDDADGYSNSSSGGGRKAELDELEIQSGLSSLTKALQFLHESAMIVHSNLTPHAVYINGKVRPRDVANVDKIRVTGKLVDSALEFQLRMNQGWIMGTSSRNTIQGCRGRFREILIF